MHYVKPLEDFLAEAFYPDSQKIVSFYKRMSGYIKSSPKDQAVKDLLIKADEALTKTAGTLFLPNEVETIVRQIGVNPTDSASYTKMLNFMVKKAEDVNINQAKTEWPGINTFIKPQQ